MELLLFCTIRCTMNVCTHIKRGYLADEHELKEIEYIYTAYSKLGGNGTGTELYERCKRLEIKEETT